MFYFFLGCTNQHKTWGAEVDKDIHLAEQHLKHGNLAQASENFRETLDLSPSSEQKEEIETLLDKIGEAGSEKEKSEALTIKMAEGEKEEPKKKELKSITFCITKTEKNIITLGAAILR